MMFPNQSNFSIAVETEGPRKISKASFPLRYGKYSIIRTSEYEFRFNLNGELKFIRGLNVNWPHPAEQLKRTDGNDWVYYTIGDKSGAQGVISWLGEYYLPCLPYPSNSIWEVNYFSNPNIMNAFGAWSQLFADLHGTRDNGLHPMAKKLVTKIINNDDRTLHERSKQLNLIIGERISVLPPDTRHVDYEVIPIIIADGCLYHCDFCCVKTPHHFKTRSREDITKQIKQLKEFYGRNIYNYNAIFLGNHDALAAEDEVVWFALDEAIQTFGLADTPKNTPMLFLFGSVDSLLTKNFEVFEKLNSYPFYTYINIGFESPDPSTLKLICKPILTSKVQDAFKKMRTINASCSNIEITGNFLMGEALPSIHNQAIVDLLRDTPAPSSDKGAIYLSPMKDSPKKRELLPQFLEIKNQSQLPVYVYLIQRL